MTSVAETVAKNLQQLRRDVGLTQEELARASGIKQASISKYEHGKAMPSGQTLMKLAAGLKRPVNEILAGSATGRAGQEGDAGPPARVRELERQLAMQALILRRLKKLAGKLAGMVLDDDPGLQDAIDVLVQLDEGARTDVLLFMRRFLVQQAEAEAGKVEPSAARAGKREHRRAADKPRGRTRAS